jgi:hemerythrin
VLFETLDLIKVPGAEIRVLFKLRDYTENHFSLEERYMVELDYPGRDMHIRAHDFFRLEIGQLLEEGIEPDDVFRDIIATFLNEWLTRHVFGIDKQLEAFILRSYAK